eukprot:3650243-Rhodomonas_salina.2
MRIAREFDACAVVLRGLWHRVQNICPDGWRLSGAQPVQVGQLACDPINILAENENFTNPVIDFDLKAPFFNNTNGTRRRLLQAPPGPSTILLAAFAC